MLGERTPSEGGGSLDEELGATTTAGDEAFDCAAGLSAWEKGWSEEKKEWCCLNKNSSTCPFDCVAGLPAWERGWSEEKKEWCCLNKNTSTCKFHFDCEAGFDRWEQGWSDEKKEWCCANRQTPTCQDLGPASGRGDRAATVSEGQRYYGTERYMTSMGNPLVDLMGDLEVEHDDTADTVPTLSPMQDKSYFDLFAA
ncbi:unnamed protein product [Prorocentrum cordatum]|uniref:Cellulase n=1 Tax=Prorocentrum cordatum TaxID=2364126 RepID=A0ABN9VMH0_9DINO|nr:unnamed protein product [Polarella glacialis]